MAPSMALFPPGKGGGEGVAHGGKGKGILIHSLTEGRGMPLANRITPANGDERAQVLPLLDRIGIPILRLASRPGATRARWGKEGIWCGPLTGWIWWAECGRTALSQTTQPSEVMRPHDDSHSAGLERLQTDLCRALGRL